jgi:Flp pilus assembly protein TadG
MKGSHRCESKRGERGQALVEFALSAIVFLVLLFGILEFGLAVWRYNMLADLAQEGARWASVRGLNSGLAEKATYQDLQNFVTSRAIGIDVTVDTALTVPEPSTLSPGDAVTVAVYSSFTPVTGLFPQSTLTLRSTAKMIMSR